MSNHYSRLWVQLLSYWRRLPSDSGVSWSKGRRRVTKRGLVKRISKLCGRRRKRGTTPGSLRNGGSIENEAAGFWTKRPSKRKRKGSGKTMPLRSVLDVRVPSSAADQKEESDPPKIRRHTTHHTWCWCFYCGWCGRILVTGHHCRGAARLVQATLGVRYDNGVSGGDNREDQARANRLRAQRKAAKVWMRGGRRGRNKRG